MTFRTTEHDSYYNVITELGVTSVLATDTPENYGYSLIDQVTILRNKFAIHIISRPETIDHLSPVISQISSSLLKEVKTKCGIDCAADLDSFSGHNTELNLELLYTGVTCSKIYKNCKNCVFDLPDNI